MPLLLDTNVCIELMRGTSPMLRERWEATPPAVIAVSVVTILELRYGAIHTSDAELRARRNRLTSAFLAPYAVEPLDRAVAETAAAIRSQLAAAGTPVGPYDLLIAATAVHASRTLITHNTREFGRVTGLSMIDWQV
jgi:tRNA(fMet)-specific endonuclease VapC